MYRALSYWVDRLPGGLLHTNIAASATFAAVSGSSVANGSDHRHGRVASVSPSRLQ